MHRAQAMAPSADVNQGFSNVWTCTLSQDDSACKAADTCLQPRQWSSTARVPAVDDTGVTSVSRARSIELQHHLAIEAGACQLEEHFSQSRVQAPAHQHACRSNIRVVRNAP